MSAYTVDDKTINRVVSFLALSGAAREYERREISKVVGARNGDFADKLADAMHVLNLGAVLYRYPNGPAMLGSFGGFRQEHADKVQVLKSLCCWLHQCTEGDFDQRPLYRAMQDLQRRLAVELVSESKAWELAEWG